MIEYFNRLIDSFIPGAAEREKSDLTLCRNFVFTHLCGPLLGQAVVLFLFFADERRDYAFWAIECCISSFWLLPFWLKMLGDLRTPAFVSCQLLIFVSLFGSFFYGGVSSPFLPWLLVALLLGFFYLSERPLLVIGGLLVQFAGFLMTYFLVGGFPERMPVEQLGNVSLISVLGAFVYMSWMSVYYAAVILQKSALEREAERERATSARLHAAMEEAERANRTKSIFLAKMSHELRTPLNAVIGYSEMLLDELAEKETNEEALNDLQRINVAGRHLLSLVTDVLDVSRIESETVEVNSAAFCVNDMLRDVVGTAEQLMKAHHNTLVVDLAGELGSATTDHRKLRQCLLNLISNAAKFTEKGRVTLRAARREEGGQDMLVFEVEDTGIGISDENLGKLFHAFAQADSSISRNFGGTGLGLTLTKQFCVALGGDVAIRSVEGKGSSFTIHVPAIFTPRAAPDQAEPLHQAA